MTVASACPVCGKAKVRYPSRKVAQFIKRKFPGEKRLSVYRCGDQWHVGHLPAAVVYGAKGRREVYGE